MDTKRLIMEKAIELFNQNGYATVSMRDIAEAAGKSVGNVTYHFNKKSDLINAIMEMQYEEYRSQNFQSDVDIKDFLKQMSKMLNHQKRYFFYFNNMIELCRTYDEVWGLNIRVKNEFTNYFVEVLENFAKRGIIKPPPSKEYFAHLATGILLIMMSWIQQSSLARSQPHEGLIEVVMSILYSNLSEKGIGMVEDGKFREEVGLAPGDDW